MARGLRISTEIKISSSELRVMLRDVHYVIEAHFEMTDRANASDNPGKFQDIITRRLRKGQAHSQPYFGTRECTAHFGLWEGGRDSDDFGNTGFGSICYMI